MNKADWERVERITKQYKARDYDVIDPRDGELEDDEASEAVSFLLGLIDKQDKVVEIARTKTDHAYYCHSNDLCTCGESELEEALKEVYGEG